jgi:hypothetical protein
MKHIEKYSKRQNVGKPRAIVKLNEKGQPFIASESGTVLAGSKLIEVEFLDGGTGLRPAGEVLIVEENDGTYSYYEEEEVDFYIRALTIEKKKYPAAFDRYSGQTGTKIFPSDFLPNEDNITFNAYIEEKPFGSEDIQFGIRSAFDDEDYSVLGPSYDYLFDHNETGRGSLFAFIEIPDGGQFEMLYLNVLNNPLGPSGSTVQIFEGYTDFTPARSLGQVTVEDSGEQILEIDFTSTPIQWKFNNYAAIKLTFDSKYNKCYGGILSTAITQVS